MLQQPASIDASIAPAIASSPAFTSSRLRWTSSFSSIISAKLLPDAAPMLEQVGARGEGEGQLDLILRPAAVAPRLVLVDDEAAADREIHPLGEDFAVARRAR